VADGLAIAADATAPRTAPTADTPIGAEPPVQTDDAPVVPIERVATTALMLLPGALVVFMGFNAGGYFPVAPAVGVIVLAWVLLARIVWSRRPFEGLAPATLVAIAALGLYATLTLASAAWSHSTSRALIDFDRVLMYVLVLVLFGAVRSNAANLRWLVRGLALGASIVCVAGLISRIAPDVWHTAPDVANQRLSYPVTYWNALGLLAALGIVFSFHLTSTLGERGSVRILAAGMLPLFAATLFFTFSRGAIAAGAVGLIVYIIIARPSGLLSGALATMPGTAALIVLAYHANLLDTVDPTTTAAVSQGHRVALGAGLCVAVCAGLRLLLAARLDPRLRRRAGKPWMSRRTRRAAIGGAAIAAIVLVFALGVPGTLSHDWNRFLSGAVPHGNNSDLRQRLTDPSNNGRSDLWRVALHGFSAEPVHGYGAGTYKTLWDSRRPHFAYTVNAHSLYLQAMAELGVPGLVLLVVLLGGVLGGLATRARGPVRSLYGALFAAGLVWALQAGVDWTWEMPVVTIPFFAAAGLALSPRGRSGQDRPAGRALRVIPALLCLGAVVLPVIMIGAQSRLSHAERALYSSDCATASAAAQSSINWLGAQPQPYEILGFCDLRRGQPRLAVAAMGEAQRRDPASWEPYYELAVAQAAAGIDPRAAAERALLMNPLEPLTLQAVKVFRGSSPTGWARQALSVRAAALASNDLSIVPS
jgi:O-antigen ligase